MILNLHHEIRGDGEPLLLLHGFTGSGGDWEHAGRDEFARSHRLIIPDARGHGRSNNPGGEFSHRLCAEDVLALLDRLGIQKIKAIGASLGGNTLLHIAVQRPELIEKMIVISATMYFPEQARAIMRTARPQSEEHFKYQLGFAESHEDMNFTPPLLATIRARTLIIYGDRDFLYPLEMGVEMYRSIPGASLCVVPNGSHTPIYAPHEREAFVKLATEFLR